MPRSVLHSASPLRQGSTCWLLTLTEDVFAVGLGYLALSQPVTTLVVVGLLWLFILVFFGVIVKVAWRRLFGRSLNFNTSGAM